MAKGKFVSSMIEMAEKAGLDMSEAARMARADELGFNVEAYHGTMRPDAIDELRVSQDGTYGKGVYVARDAYDAEKYAGFGRVTQMGGSIYPLKVKGGKYWDVMSQGLPRDSFSGTNDDIIKELTDRGYIGIDAGNEMVIFDPKNIRSVNAAFDPAKKDSSNILAGAATIGGVGTGAALMATPQNSYAQGQEYKPTAQDIMRQQRRIEDYNSKIDYLNKNKIQSPISKDAEIAAMLAGNYNAQRKERLHPLLDLLLPAGEAPQEYMNKIAYGDKITWTDRLKALAGLL